MTSPAVNTATDRAVAAATAFLEWTREELGDSTIAAADNFLDVGGNSAIAIHLRAKLLREFKVALDPKELFSSSIEIALERSTSLS